MNQKYVFNGVPFTMIYVKGGTFMMGNQEKWCEGNTHEHPLHSVTLNSYFIAEAEVTQESWEVVMGSNPSSTKSFHHPVESVTWEDCQEFIRFLNAHTGKIFRLPTEAKWEYVARGGCKSNGCIFVNDMSGYVYEWCQDWFGDYHSLPHTNPHGPSEGSYHVCRGGCMCLPGNCFVYQTADRADLTIK